MKEKRDGKGAGYILLVGLVFLLMFSLVLAVPEGGILRAIKNETRTPVSGSMLNISGGYIATINISATVQNPRWKGIVGNVTGSFTLDDAGGSTIYNWALTSITGEVYATRNDSTISWTDIDCATRADLETENYRINHTNADDNITATFITGNVNHAEFYVGTTKIDANSCPTLNSYVNNATAADFEEVALFESTGSNIVFATVLEQDAVGFNSDRYDFEMIVPENGAAGFSGATAYYMYVELS